MATTRALLTGYVNRMPEVSAEYPKENIANELTTACAPLLKNLIGPAGERRVRELTAAERSLAARWMRMIVCAKCGARRRSRSGARRSTGNRALLKFIAAEGTAEQLPVVFLA